MQSILIVDDDVDLCTLMRFALKDNYRVDSLHNLGDARTRLSRSAISLLLLDNSLPDGKGVDFIHEALELNPAMKIVIITADAPEQLQDRAMEQGACHFMKKPFDLAALDKVVKSIFRHVA